MPAPSLSMKKRRQLSLGMVGAVVAVALGLLALHSATAPQPNFAVAGPLAAAPGRGGAASQAWQISASASSAPFTAGPVQAQSLGAAALAAACLCVAAAARAGAGRAKSVTNGKAARFALRVEGQICSALAFLPPTAALVGTFDIFEAAVPTLAPTFEPLISLDEVAHVVQAAEPLAVAVATAVALATAVVAPSVEELPSGWSAPSPLRSPAAARRIGASRHASPRHGAAGRVRMAAAAAASAAHRTVGAKLQERSACPEVAPLPFDAATLRREIQRGLQQGPRTRGDAGREAKMASSSDLSDMRLDWHVLAYEFDSQEQF
mmetsp:Transcript_97551/g.247844  ORF Transcript_97551/g.247844 Transcript_97551/m.247844 type:complete len:321 (+) Transcript_97551:87-1049(+)